MDSHTKKFGSVIAVFAIFVLGLVTSCGVPSQPCSGGRCHDGDIDGDHQDGDVSACEGVTCDSPPPSECIGGSTLRTSRGPGQCDQGNCTYEFTYVECSAGCDEAEGTCSGCKNECPGANFSECLSGQIRTCEVDGEGCLKWSDFTLCPSGSCDGTASCSTCENPCTSGQSECAEGEFRTCIEEAGCWVWSESRTCEEGFCHDEFSCGGCENGCFVSSETECVDGEFRTCEGNDFGCLNWSDFSLCGDGFCADDSTCGVCADECPASSETECADARIRICETDEHGCLVWGAWTDCPGGSCSDDATCDDLPVHDPFEDRCDSGPVMDREAAIEFIGKGESSRAYGRTMVYRRTRTCVPATGCGDWEESAEFGEALAELITWGTDFRVRFSEGPFEDRELELSYMEPYDDGRVATVLWSAGFEDERVHLGLYLRQGCVGFVAISDDDTTEYAGYWEYSD